MIKLPEKKKRDSDFSVYKVKIPFQKLSAFWDFFGPIILTFSLYGGIKYFIAEARYIPSSSMFPTLQINDRLIIEKLSYRKRSPRRGEVVVFNSPYSFNNELILRRSRPLPSAFKCGVVNFPLISFFSGIVDPACYAYIKRVVAIAGDSVLVNSKGSLFINDQLVVEPYVSNLCALSKTNFGNCRPFRKDVPPKHVFVLGDNRANSWDGRFWPGNGFLPENEILGRAVWRFWPFSRIGGFSKTN